MFYIVRLRLGLKGLLHHGGRCSTGRMMKNIKTDSLFNPGKQKAVGDSVVRLITFVLPVYVLAFDLVTTVIFQTLRVIRFVSAEH